MSTALGIAAGVALGMLSVVLIGGIPGVVIGVVVAALGYVGVSNLTARERRLGGVEVSLLPNGEYVSNIVDDATGLMGRLDEDIRVTQDDDVRAGMGQVRLGLDRNVSYVLAHPGEYEQLRHFMNTYGTQIDDIANGWRAIEEAGNTRAMRESKADMMDALRGLSTALENSLGNAADRQSVQIEAASEAIRRLAETDGYDITAPVTGTGDDGYLRPPTGR